MARFDYLFLFQFITSLVEEFTRVLSGEGDMSGNVAHQLDDMGQMVFVPGVILTGVRFKEIITRGQLERHAGRRPNIGSGVVTGPQQDFQGSVLSSLNVFREVMILHG